VRQRDMSFIPNSVTRCPQRATAASRAPVSCQLRFATVRIVWRQVVPSCMRSCLPSARKS
jgi:hypothetical protein